MSHAIRARRWLWPAGLALFACACDGGKTLYMGEHTAFAGCESTPVPPPAQLGLSSFYAKYLDGYGTPVVSSGQASDRALQVACRITGEMLSLRSDVRAALAANRLRVAVIATSEVTTDIPEYADLYAAFPNIDWNSKHGIGATPIRPVVSDSEENLLCLPGDPDANQNTLVQMLAHALRDMGAAAVDAQFSNREQSAYASALNNGLWANTWAINSADDYWAMGSEVWFGATTLAPVTSRARLLAYDSALAALLGEYLPADDWHAGCY
jgi:hypothetical protein